MLIHPSHQPQANRGLLVILITALCIFLFSWLVIPAQHTAQILHYLLWHTTLQGLGIVMALQIFTLILSTYKNRLPTPLVALGILFLGVAVIDFSHALAQQGMPKLVDTQYQNHASFLLFSTRLLSAIGMLFIGLYSWKKAFNPRYFLPVLIPFVMAIALLHWLVFFHPTTIPNMLSIEPNAKTLSSSLSVFLLGMYFTAALLLFLRLKKTQSFTITGFFLASSLLTLAQAYNISSLQTSQLHHLISHLYGIAAIYFLYRAVFNEIVLNPYTLLQDSKKRMAATLSATPDMIIELDSSGNPIEIHNHNADKNFFEKQQLLNKNIESLLSPEDVKTYRNSLEEAKEKGVSRNKIIEYKPSHEEKQWLELSVSFVAANKQIDERFIVIARNITDRVKETKKLTFLSRAVDQIPSMIFILDNNFRIQFINRTFTEMTGYAFTEIKGRSSSFLFSADTPEGLQKNIQAKIQSGGIWHGEIKRTTKSGKEYAVQSSFYPILTEGQTAYNYLVIENDITESKEIAAQLQRISNFDRLTGLPNADRLRVLLNHELKHSSHVAILWINLDRFKNVNEGLGHHIGDALLKEVADRLSNLLRPQDILARPNGDNFVMLLPGAEHDLAAAQAQAVLNAFGLPLVSANRTIVLSASIGISTYPWDSIEGNMLLAQAETAMHRMKKECRGGYCFFKSTMREETAYKLVISMALKEALKNQEMYLVYQPQISLKTGQIIGVEALLRWKSSVWGEVPTKEFIAIAEESGDIVQIGQWVLNKAWQQMQDWKKRGTHIPRISVNISATQFEQEDFINSVIALSENNEDSKGELKNEYEGLEIEITEAVAMNNPCYSATLIQELKNHKIRIAIDDFGTGYSSLGSLKNFNIDTLKIDRSFVKELNQSKGDQAVVNAIVSMAHDLGIDTIAEGVENKEQLQYLYEQGCDAIQGFYFARPLTATELENLLNHEHSEGCFSKLLTFKE